MVVRHHLAEAIDVLPHTLVLSVEDVRPVDVDHRSVSMAHRMTVTGDVGTCVEHDRAVTGFGQLAGYHGT